jgi:glycosyltransferase involved in cell wall biosynthesis
MPVTNYHYQVLKKLLTSEELKRIHLVGVSKSQVEGFAEDCEIIPNGVNLDDFPFSEKYRDSFVWIGRIIPEKGAKDAIEAAKKAQVKLELAGKPKAKREEEYFNQEMKPLFDDFVYYRGFVQGEARREFYYGKALIFPSKAQESFGLTMIEALSSGTPVIAYDRGAVREVIEEGKTGFIVPADDIDAIANAMKKINSMSEEEYLIMRKNCREVAEKRFSLKVMVDRYMDLYQKVSNE